MPCKDVSKRMSTQWRPDPECGVGKGAAARESNDGPAGCYARSGRGQAKPASKRDGELLHREGARPLRVKSPRRCKAASASGPPPKADELLQRRCDVFVPVPVSCRRSKMLGQVFTQRTRLNNPWQGDGNYQQAELATSGERRNSRCSRACTVRLLASVRGYGLTPKADIVQVCREVRKVPGERFISGLGSVWP